MSQLEMTAVTMTESRQLRPFPSWLPKEQEIISHFAKTASYSNYKLTLVRYLSTLLPESGPCTLLDVGAGDGRLSSFFQKYRPATQGIGIETFLRHETERSIPMVLFDGKSIPFVDGAFDVSMICDVLHHTKNQNELISEVFRVTRRKVLVKDHLCRSVKQKYQLYVLDLLGNYRFGIRVTGDYLSLPQWEQLLSSKRISSLSVFQDVPVRKPPLSYLFDNSVEVLFEIDLKQTPEYPNKNRS
jgi:ubiquinone/menaquinone biosynthesis C-methylase UbiE